MMKRLVTIILTITLALALVGVGGGCGFKAPLTPEKAGKLQMLDYSYGTPLEDDMSFSLRFNHFTASSYVDGEKAMNVAGDIKESGMLDLARIIQANGIFDWNGFNAEPDGPRVGYEFSLWALYDGGEISAYGYEKFPKNYKQGHDALAGYLEALAKEMPAVVEDEPEPTDGSGSGAGSGATGGTDFMWITDMSVEELSGQLDIGNNTRRTAPNEKGYYSVLIYDKPDISYLFYEDWGQLFGVVLREASAPVHVFGARAGMQQKDAEALLKQNGFEQNTEVNEQGSLFFELIIAPDYYDPNVAYYVDPLEYYFVELNTENNTVKKITAFYGTAAQAWQEMRERIKD